MINLIRLRKGNRIWNECHYIYAALNTRRLLTITVGIHK